jgi:hypothetical protein
MGLLCLLINTPRPTPAGAASASGGFLPQSATKGERSHTSAKGTDGGVCKLRSFEQNESWQLEGLALDRVFLNKASGKDIYRPQLEAPLKYVRDGDMVVCHSMDRLARNLVDLRKTVSDLTTRKIGVRFMKESDADRRRFPDGDVIAEPDGIVCRI